MASKKSVVIGYDMVSPLGTDLDSQWRRAANGESGIGPLTRFDLLPDFPVTIAGEVAPLDTSPYPFLSDRKLALWPSPIFKHALLVVHRALERSGVAITPDLAPRVAVTFSSAVGGQDAVLNADRRLMGENKWPPPYSNPNACINMVGGKVSIFTGASGPIVSTITACATGATSMVIGAMLLESGQADVAICGAADFCLVEPIVAGFATMNGAYQVKPEKTKPGFKKEPPERASRPFSLNRRGFVISEGAGAVILATPDFAAVHGLSAPIELAGWAMTSDAHHYVAPHLPTVARCISDSIDNAGIAMHDVASVNAHAASTKIGDQVEYQALRTVFGDQIPTITANKSMIGHAMGASSVIESILTMEGMKKEIILPTINHTPDPDLALSDFPSRVRPIPQVFALKNAFGFGGCNTAIVFRRLE